MSADVALAAAKKAFRAVDATFRSPSPATQEEARRLLSEAQALCEAADVGQREMMSALADALRDLSAGLTLSLKTPRVH
jgi:hypothetical protein